MKSLLLKAAASGALLEMIYQDCKGNISQRRIKVLSVNEESLKAYCYIRKQQRTFKITNILSVGPVGNLRRGA
ncbi:hypothetical protein ACFFHH_20250 [Cytobacillus solani]|uniref:WYL domain-containing protein n=1 Tax=Cytobacillus solani TaxID=1637975 RepID=A0A0Q3VHY2_9BACI|nr:hypothetical protein [Cytobacillus solani]KOP84133.1 hypothetical protein AMS60_00375 [Bacillus sp. FJAT-21945]KQL20975.1 hypothetical protein AN957_21910 [Cytobacillus solani]